MWRKLSILEECSVQRNMDMLGAAIYISKASVVVAYLVWGNSRARELQSESKSNWIPGSGMSPSRSRMFSVSRIRTKSGTGIIDSDSIRVSPFFQASIPRSLRNWNWGNPLSYSKYHESLSIGSQERIFWFYILYFTCNLVLKYVALELKHSIFLPNGRENIFTTRGEKQCQNILFHSKPYSTLQQLYILLVPFRRVKVISWSLKTWNSISYLCRLYFSLTVCRCDVLVFPNYTLGHNYPWGYKQQCKWKSDNFCLI
jgi:hypothetical protein